MSGKRNLLLGLLQLLQLGNNELEDIFQQYEVDTRSLLQKVTAAV